MSEARHIELIKAVRNNNNKFFDHYLIDFPDDDFSTIGEGNHPLIAIAFYSGAMIIYRKLCKLLNQEMIDGVLTYGRRKCKNCGEFYD